MKKTFFTFLILFITLLTSCSFWIDPLTATVTVINETDQTWYYLAYYNGCAGGRYTKGVRSIEPNSEFTFQTEEGYYTKADIQKQDDYFSFYYCNETEWETKLKEEYEEDLNSDLGLFYAIMNFQEDSTCLREEGKESQNYTVRIYPDPLNDSSTLIKVTWK